MRKKIESKKVEIEETSELFSEFMSEKRQKILTTVSIIGGGVTLLLFFTPILTYALSLNVKAYKGLKNAMSK